jgi:acyl carrier protein
MVFDIIAELIAERNDCDVSEIKPESKFSDLGIDSLDTVEMMMSLEERLGREIEIDRRVETVGEFAAYVEEKLAENK